MSYYAFEDIKEKEVVVSAFFIGNDGNLWEVCGDGTVQEFGADFPSATLYHEALFGATHE